MHNFVYFGDDAGMMESISLPGPGQMHDEGEGQEEEEEEESKKRRSMRKH